MDLWSYHEPCPGSGSTWTVGIPIHKAAILGRCLHLAVAGTGYEKAHSCHVFPDPPELEAYGLLDTRGADTPFDIGHRHCMRFHDRLLAADDYPATEIM